MALPERRHFDIESAAEYLGCSVSDLNYYLDEGMLRFAFYITEDWMPLDAFAHDDLSQELQTKMYRLPDLPDDHDFKKIKRKAPEKSSCPGFLYVSGYHRRLALEKMNADGARIYYFETLNGESINIWAWGSLSYALSHLREDGELSGTVIPREELDRFAPEAKGKAKPNEKTVEPKPDKSEEVRLFAYPKLADEIAQLMTDQMNRFIKENGQIASEKILRDYIVEGTYVSYDHRDKQLEVGDEEDRPVYLSFKSFKRRYNNYFGPN